MSSIKNYLQTVNPKVLEFLFTGPYFFYIIINCLLMTTIPLPSILAPISKLPLVFVILKIVIDVINKRIPKEKLIYLLPLGLISVMIFLLAKQTMVIYLAILTIGAHDIHAKKLLKQHVKVIGSILIALILLSSLGIIENVVVYREDGLTARYSFGITYPTDFAALVFYLYALKYAVSDKKLGWTYALFGLGAAVFLIVFSHARLDAMIIGMFAVFILLSKYLKKFGFIKKIFMFSFVAFFILTIVLSFTYNPANPVFVRLNTLLSNRLTLGMQAVQNYDFKLFGQYIELNGFGDFNPNIPYHFIDSSYLQIVLRFGVLYALFYCVVYTKFVASLIKKQGYGLVILCAFVSLHAFFSHHIFNPVYNPIWVLFFADFSDVAFESKNQKQLAVVGQLGDPKTGLGKALNDFSAFSIDELSEQQVLKIDIIQNKHFFKHINAIAKADVAAYYFTPAGSLGGHLRDLCYLLIMIAKRRRVVLHFHNSNFGNVIQKHSLLLLVNRWLFKRIDRVILLGQKQTEMFDGLNLPVEKFAFIPNPIDNELFIDEATFKQKNRKRIIYFSNMLPEKGYAHVLEAAKAFRKTDYEFYFSGKFYDEVSKGEFLEAIKDLPQVTYIEGVYGADKKRLLEKMDYFILPSEYKDETLPISMLEAMANALFIIVTPRGVIPEVLNFKTSRLLVEVNGSEVIDAILDAELPQAFETYQINDLRQKYDSQTILSTILSASLGGGGESSE